MDFSNHLSRKPTVQYSKPISLENSTVARNNTELSSFSDLITNLDFVPWYSSKLRLIGMVRFTELARKARATSETPSVLFKWMIQNEARVK